MSDTEKTRSARLLETLQNNRIAAVLVVIAAIVGGIASTSKSLSEIYSLIGAHVNAGAVAVVLPHETGWILCGYYDESSRKFIEGPYCKVMESSYPEPGPLPRIGESVKLIASRKVVIADFATMGLTRQFVPPWKQNILRDGDYTGISLPAGAVVIIRDV